MKEEKQNTYFHFLFLMKSNLELKVISDLSRKTMEDEIISPLKNKVRFHYKGDIIDFQTVSKIQLIETQRTLDSEVESIISFELIEGMKDKFLYKVFKGMDNVFDYFSSDKGADKNHLHKDRIEFFDSMRGYDIIQLMINNGDSSHARKIEKKLAHKKEFERERYIKKVFAEKSNLIENYLSPQNLLLIDINSKVRELLKKDKTQESIEAILHYLRDYNSKEIEFMNILITQASNLERVKKQRLAGVISEKSYSAEKGKINFKILEILNEIVDKK